MPLNEQTRALWLAASATFLVLFAYTAPLGALDAMFGALRADATGRAWIVSAMSVGLGATLLVSGAIADARGRRLAFVAGALVLAASSALAAIATTTFGFSLARIAQGIGGAALTSSGLGTVGHLFTDPNERTRATGLWGASLGAGIAAGPLGSAGLAALFDWRATNWFAAIAGVGLALLASRVLPDSRAAVQKAIDLVGATLLVLALTALLGGCIEARHGWVRPLTLGLLGSGIVLLVAFVVRQARVSTPILELALFRRYDFVAATVAAFTTGMGIIATITFLPVVLGRGLGHAGAIGAAMTLPWSLGSVVSAIAARRLPARVSPRVRMIVSLVAIAIGQVAIAWVARGSSLSSLLPGLCIAGIGSGVLNATMARQSVASVPAANAAMGSGANNTARYVGAAFGIALVALLLGGESGEALIERWNRAAQMTAVFSLLGALFIGVRVDENVRR